MNWMKEQVSKNYLKEAFPINLSNLVSILSLTLLIAGAAQPKRLCEEISDATAIRIFVGECMAELMKPLKVATFDPLVGTDEQTSP